MTIYLLMFVYISFLAFFSLKYEDKAKELGFLVLPTFFFFLIIAGSRTSSVGGDLVTYIHIFESNHLQLPDLSNLFRSRFELGYLVSNIFLRNFSEHYPFLLFSYAFITLIAWFLVLYKHSKNVYISLLIYFSSLGLFFYSLSNIRQGLAIALSFLGFHYLVKNKKILASIFILLTPLFHTSGIVCFLFFPLKKIVLNKRTYQFVFILFPILYPFIKQIATTFISFFPQYTSYLESSWFLESNKWAPIFLTIWYGIVLLFGELVIRKKKLSTEEEYIRSLFFISFLLTASTLQTSLFGRFAHYFTPFICLYIPMILSKIGEKKVQWILFYLVILVYASIFLVIVYFKTDWYHVVPYRSVIVDWLFGN